PAPRTRTPPGGVSAAFPASARARTDVALRSGWPTCLAAARRAMMGVMGGLAWGRLAAVDMYGAAGTRRRRRLIRAEFVLGAAGGIGLGVWAAATAATAGLAAVRR